MVDELIGWLRLGYGPKDLFESWPVGGEDGRQAQHNDWEVFNCEAFCGGLLHEREWTRRKVNSFVLAVMALFSYGE